MRFGSDLLKIDIIGHLHVLCVDTQDLESTCGVWNTDVNFSIESSESSKSRIDRVGSVGSGHDDYVRAGLETVHKGEKLRNDSSFNFTVRLVTLRGNRIDFVDEDDSWCVFLCFFESLSKIRFGFL